MIHFILIPHFISIQILSFTLVAILFYVNITFITIPYYLSTLFIIIILLCSAIMSIASSFHPLYFIQ